MPTPEILKIPNLLSLSRIVLAPIICYFLSRDDTTGIIVSLLLIVVAGVTDGLDGYLARRWKQTGRLGTALDPIADKLFAALLVLCLIIHRDFPIWLASVIVGRDLLIVGLGLLLVRGRNISLPSNLTGKYAFSAIVALLASYLIRFEFGILMTTWTTIILITASLYGYGKVFVLIKRGKPAPEFADNKYLIASRTAATTIYTIIFFYKLYVDLLR
jgi:CDP-diacylglycerol--glycerol-3-phosphate 3-phosphatidyltransferase